MSAAYKGEKKVANKKECKARHFSSYMCVSLVFIIVVVVVAV